MVLIYDMIHRTIAEGSSNPHSGVPSALPTRIEEGRLTKTNELWHCR